MALDYDAAFAWFQKSAAQRFPSGLYNLALCYEEGRGVKRDKKKAIEYYSQAAELGDEDAAEKVKKLKKKFWQS